MQRLSHGTMIAGWVETFTPESVTIRCAPEHDLQVSDRFFIEIQKDGKAIFMASLAHVGDPVYWEARPKGAPIQSSTSRLATFKVCSGIKFHDGRGRGRSVRALAVSVDHDRQSLHAATTDVSERGIGILSSKPLPVGDTVHVRFDTRSGPVACTGTVRHCQHDDGMGGFYRVGIELAGLSETDSRRILGVEAA